VTPETPTPSAGAIRPGLRGPDPGRLIDILEKTRPWIRMLAIAGFVVCGLLLLVAASFLLLGSRGAAPLSRIGLLYLVIAIGYALPTVTLYRYAAELREVVEDRTSMALEVALHVHRRFWLTAGVVGIVLILVNIAGIGLGVVLPNLHEAMERSRAKRTIADVRAIGQALEAYATDHQRYPDAQSLEELAGVLEPKYMKKVPRTDGWGNDLIYVRKCNSGWCWDYRVSSPGVDGKPDITDEKILWALSDPDDYRHRELRNHYAGKRETGAEPEAAVTLETILQRDVIYGSGLLLWAPEQFTPGEVAP
jgi:general secretion pathway protein G